jgi:hypothetical protein
MVPEKDLTFLAFANSDALSRGTGLGRGCVVRSPAGLIFLENFGFVTKCPSGKKLIRWNRL